MDPSQWSRVRAAIDRVMPLPAEQRLAALQSEDIDEEVLRDAEQLLLLADGASALLGGVKWNSALGSQEPDLSGSLLGQYRLVRELGRGGMGAVYLAERADGLYQQQVALKVLQAMLVSPRIVERFQQERQILARLKHPGIARLLDGGVTQDGRPYLVLELVEGTPIDRFCDDEGLDVPARLRLFCKVADAVQSAHQQLVLHLDLKPANVLVDKDGEPHLLDFGVSQLLGVPPEKAAIPEETLKLMTPRYASPEQIAGQQLTVASDIFSMATMLYRLLTGKLPYPIEDTSFFETARIIVEQDAAPPSDVAPRDRRSQLRGDLDSIVLQGLRKEPELRYPTAAAFAADAQRYLNLQPVLAHGDSLRYRAGKFIRRNRVSVTTAGVAAVLLVGSGVAVVRSDMVARRQRSMAEKRLNDLRDLAHSYVFELDSMLEEVPGTIHIRHFVLQKAQAYLEKTSAELDNDEYLEKEIAEGYVQIGRVQALPGLPSMSDWKAAAVSQAKGTAIARRMLARHPTDASAQSVLLRHLMNEDQVYQTVGDLPRRQQIMAEEWQIAQQLMAGGTSALGYTQGSVVAWTIALLHCGNGDDWNLADPAGSLPWLQRTERIAQDYLRENPQGKRASVAKAMLERVAINRAYLAEHSEHPLDARSFYDQAMALTSGSDLVEQETHKQLRGFYADYLLQIGDARAALAMAPAPEKEASVHERGKDRSLSADEADEMQLLGRISLRLGRIDEGRKMVEAGLKAYDALFAGLPEDALLSSSIAHSHFDYAEEPLVPRAVRRAHYEVAVQISNDAARRMPAALSVSLFLGRCYAGLASLSAAERMSRSRRSTRVWLSRSSQRCLRHIQTTMRPLGCCSASSRALDRPLRKRAGRFALPCTRSR